MSDDRRLEILQIFAEESDHNRRYTHRDPLRRTAGGDSVWRQRMSPTVYWASLAYKHAAREAERYRTEPAVRQRAAKRYQKATEAERKAQDARVLAAARKLPPDGLARARALCLDCRKLPPGIWCFTHERITTMRHKLEKTRNGITHHFTLITRTDPNDSESTEVMEIDGYITANVDAAGRLGEIFIRIGKIGSAAALLDQWAVSTSIALQRGEPVSTLFKKFEHTQFEPSGMTRNPEIPMCSSLVDYIAKYILKNFSGVTNWAEPTPIAVVDSTEETTKP